jgi:hypothetical protein
MKLGTYFPTGQAGPWGPGEEGSERLLWALLLQVSLLGCTEAWHPPPNPSRLCLCPGYMIRGPGANSDSGLVPVASAGFGRIYQVLLLHKVVSPCSQGPPPHLGPGTSPQSKGHHQPPSVTPPH